MPVLYIRAIEPYQPGSNASEVIINQIHMNRPALTHYNYTLYSNGTLSNGTDCYLAFQNYQPYMFPTNGSFVNGTSCYAPIHPLRHHASTGMAFALLFVFSIIASMANLRKHGTSYLPVDKRWTLAGRRWKWYWLLGLGVCGAIASFMSIDVDRDHVQNAPLVIQSVFYTLLLPLMMAALWEAVRNWATWQERQISIRDPLAFNDDTEPSSRKIQERILPLVFYLFTLITLILSMARSWATVELQRDPQQQSLRAKPFATDPQFRASGVIALVAACVIVYSLGHSVYRYRPGLSPSSTGKRRPTTTRRQKRRSPVLGIVVYETPPQFIVGLILLTVKIVYAIAASFSWAVSPLRFGVNPGWIYGLGYAPVLLLVTLFNVCGLCEVNEDKALMVAQRTLFEVDSSNHHHRDGRVALSRVTGKRQWWLWSEWLGRVFPATGSLNDGSVDMYPIVKDDNEVGKQASTASTVPVSVRADGLVNPFSNAAGLSSASNSDDSMSFVGDVLSELENVEYR